MASPADRVKEFHLTLHDVTPYHRSTIEHMHQVIFEMGIHSYSMLVIPDFHGKWPLEKYPDFCRWLRELRESGVEMMLHGYSHLGTAEHLNLPDRLRSITYTRGEGEFLEMDRDIASGILRRGKAKLEKLLDTEINCFVAPAWLYSSGTLEALGETGFTYSESRWRTWNPSSGEVLLRVPVVNFAGGSICRKTLAGIWVALSRLILRDRRTVRFALHPCDFEDEKRLKNSLRYLQWLSEKRVPVTSGRLRSMP